MEKPHILKGKMTTYYRGDAERIHHFLKVHSFAKRWLRALCGFCIAVMIAGCGDTTDIMQTVEPEDIIAPEEKEKTAQEEKKKREKPDETAGAMPESASVESVPEESAVVTVETDKQEYKDGDRIIMVTNYDEVTVTIEGNETATAAVMAEFAKRKEEFEKGLDLEVTLEMARENPVVDGNIYYSEEQWYTLERNDGRVLSFSTMWDVYEGGAHGQYMRYGVNFDGRTGKLLTIDDITPDKGAFQDICVQEMLRQCEDLKAQHLLFEEEMITPSLREVLEGKMDGAEWYFTENGIRFISNIYEIAPYAAGSIDFDIPYEMIDKVLKEQYRG